MGGFGSWRTAAYFDAIRLSPSGGTRVWTHWCSATETSIVAARAKQHEGGSRDGSSGLNSVGTRSADETTSGRVSHAASAKPKLSAGLQAAVGVGPLNLVGGSLGVSIELIQKQRRRQIRTERAKRLLDTDDKLVGDSRRSQERMIDARRRVVNSGDLRSALALLALELHWAFAVAAGIAEQGGRAEEATSLQSLARRSRNLGAHDSSKSGKVASIVTNDNIHSESMGDGSPDAPAIHWSSILQSTDRSVPSNPAQTANAEPRERADALNIAETAVAVLRVL